MVVLDAIARWAAAVVASGSVNQQPLEEIDWPWLGTASRHQMSQKTVFEHFNTVLTNGFGSQRFQDALSARFGA